MLLSLPDTWNYSVRGLSSITPDGVDGVLTALKELERLGYLERNQQRESNGRMGRAEYVIYEMPRKKPCSESPCTEKPYTVNPDTDTPVTENPAQLSTNRTSTETINKREKKEIQHRYAPKKFVITFAVMLRYIPTIQEDWHFVKDAMRMRDVSPSLGGFLSHPGMTVECIYVPLMMMASKAADELSIASVTRGIENPNPRTCLVQIKCGIADWMAMLIAVAFFIFELCMRGGVTG